MDPKAGIHGVYIKSYSQFWKTQSSVFPFGIWQSSWVKGTLGPSSMILFGVVGGSYRNQMGQLAAFPTYLLSSFWSFLASK